MGVVFNQGNGFGRTVLNAFAAAHTFFYFDFG
jgi:hypothetical protein